MKHHNSSLGMRFLRLALYLTAAITCSLNAGGIVIANDSTSYNDRFSEQPSALSEDWDLSGVGRTLISGSETAHWATLIGDDIIISANHHHPGIGDTVRFAAGNSLSSTVFDYQVEAGGQIGNTDLWIGVLAGTADQSLTRYSYARNSATNLSETGLIGSDLLMSGDRIAGQAGSLHDHALGLNRAEAFYRHDDAVPRGSFESPGVTVRITVPDGFQNDMLVLYQNLAADTSHPVMASEAYLQSGDSGSPLFSLEGEEMVLQGIGSLTKSFIAGNFQDTVSDPDAFEPLEVRNATLYSHLGSSTNELDDLFAVPDLLSLPEPSTPCLILLSLPLLTAKNRCYHKPLKDNDR